MVYHPNMKETNIRKSGDVNELDTDLDPRSLRFDLSTSAGNKTFAALIDNL